MSLTDDFEALANAYDVLSKDHDLTSHDRAFYAAVRDRIRVLLASHKEQDWTCKLCGQTGIANYEHHVCPGRSDTERVAKEQSSPDMQKIMAENGHPDEGPCVVCGHVFDAHNAGCVFEEQSSPLRDDWEWLETKLSEWDGYQISVGLNILNHIKSVLSARKAALTARESAKKNEKGPADTRQFRCEKCGRKWSGYSESVSTANHFHAEYDGMCDGKVVEESAKPEEKRYVCEGCGEKQPFEGGLNDDHTQHWSYNIGTFGSWCGPVVEEPKREAGKS